MIVAQHHPNVTGLLQDGPLIVSARPAARPVVRRHMAFLSTPWGICAIVWKVTDDRTTFGETPVSALLCRILTPGLTHQELRLQILKQHGACDEVMSDREGNFHPEIVPTWFPELAGWLRAYYTTGVCGGV